MSRPHPITDHGFFGASALLIMLIVVGGLVSHSRGTVQPRLSARSMPTSPDGQTGEQYGSERGNQSGRITLDRWGEPVEKRGGS